MLDTNFKQPLGINLAIEHLLWGGSFRCGFGGCLYTVEQVTPGVGVICWATFLAVMLGSRTLLSSSCKLFVDILSSY